jgi:tetratricopeptide (TPR) repeat protein
MMFNLRYISAVILACVFLNACAVRPTKQQLTVKPVNEIKHSENVNADAHYQRGTYYQTRGNLNLALEAYNDALGLDSRHAEARNAMATIYSQQGNFAKAESSLREAVVQNPNAAHLRNNLGYVHYLRGNHESAMKEFRAALSLEPKNEWARNNLEMAQDAMSKRVSKLVERPKSAVPPPTVTVTPLDIWSDIKVTENTKPYMPTAGNNTAPAIQSEIKPTAVLIASNEFRLEISNGSGIPGLAKRLSQVLTRLGIPVKIISNEQPYRQVVTDIQYREGFEKDAKNLRDKLNGQALVSRVSAQAKPIDIRVVVGKDLKTHIAKIETQNSTRLATANNY